MKSSDEVRGKASRAQRRKPAAPKRQKAPNASDRRAPRQRTGETQNLQCRHCGAQFNVLYPRMIVGGQRITDI